MINEVGISFPLDLWKEIIMYSKPHLTHVACINRQFEKLAHEYFENHPCKEFIGEKVWIKFGGDPGSVITVPVKMIQDFDATKQILTFIPETINNVPLTLSSFMIFLSDSKIKEKTKFKNSFSNIAHISDEIISKVRAHWVILSKDVLQGTRSEVFETQKKLVKAQGFQIPNLIDFLVSVSLFNLMNPKESLYPSNTEGRLMTYTRVKEKNKSGRRIMVGVFSDNGLNICANNDPNICIGAAYSKKSH